jgi:methionyl-tRNA formyltransferase
LSTVYLGTSAFAVTVLERLIASPHAPSLVITRPDRPAGRGRKLQSPPVAEAARAAGIPLLQPDRASTEEVTAQIAAEQPTAVIVCAYGALIAEPLLSAFAFVNVHPSLLPRWRGAAPIERAIAAGDAETGVGIMRLEAGLDTGPVAALGRIPIAPDDTYGTLAPRLAELAGDLLIGVLDEHPDYVPQPEDGVTYAEKIGPADRTIDPAAPAIVSERMIRALTPHIGARLELPDGTLLGVREAQLLPDQPDDDQIVSEDGVLRVGALALTVVQPPGGRAMPVADYLRGRTP